MVDGALHRSAFPGVFLGTFTSEDLVRARSVFFKPNYLESTFRRPSWIEHGRDDSPRILLPLFVLEDVTVVG